MPPKKDAIMPMKRMWMLAKTDRQIACVSTAESHIHVQHSPHMAILK